MLLGRIEMEINWWLNRNITVSRAINDNFDSWQSKKLNILLGSHSLNFPLIALTIQFNALTLIALTIQFNALNFNFVYKIQVKFW